MRGGLATPLISIAFYCLSIDLRCFYNSFQCVYNAFTMVYNAFTMISMLLQCFYNVLLAET